MFLYCFDLSQEFIFMLLCNKEIKTKKKKVHCLLESLCDPGQTTDSWKMDCRDDEVDRDATIKVNIFIVMILCQSLFSILDKHSGICFTRTS